MRHPGRKLLGVVHPPPWTYAGFVRTSWVRRLVLVPSLPLEPTMTRLSGRGYASPF